MCIKLIKPTTRSNGTIHRQNNRLKKINGKLINQQTIFISIEYIQDSLFILSLSLLSLNQSKRMKEEKKEKRREERRG